MFQIRVDTDIQLGLLESRHAEELFELTDRNRNYLSEWLPWVDQTTSVKDSKAFIEMCLTQFANNRGFAAGIFYQGQLAGVIGYHPINWSNRDTSIGYWLGSEYQGHGIMTRACSAMVNYAFRELKLNRIEIRAGEYNQKSRAIPERLGFMKEGVVRQAEWLYDHYIDLVIYGMLAQDWKEGTY